MTTSAENVLAEDWKPEPDQDEAGNQQPSREGLGERRARTETRRLGRQPDPCDEADGARDHQHEHPSEMADGRRRMGPGRPNGAVAGHTNRCRPGRDGAGIDRGTGLTIGLGIKLGIGRDLAAASAEDGGTMGNSAGAPRTARRGAASVGTILSGALITVAVSPGRTDGPALNACAGDFRVICS